jgi:hypothetical protein
LLGKGRVFENAGFLPLKSGLDWLGKYWMRIFEITTRQSTKPLTAAQARIRALKHNVEQGRQQLDAERERQQRQRESERKTKEAKRRAKALGALST